MSIVVCFKPTMTKEQYREAERRMEAAGIWPHPDGLEFHVSSDRKTTSESARSGTLESSLRRLVRS